MTDQLILHRYQQLWLVILLLMGGSFLLTELHLFVGMSFIVIIVIRAGLSLSWWQSIDQWKKAVLVAAALVILTISYDSFYSLDTMVSLLLLMWGLKLLETQRRRDALILVLINFFVMFSQLLYSQTLISVSMVVINAILSITVLAIEFGSHRKKALKYSIETTIISSVLAILMFMIMPRAGALWKIPLARDTAVTGLSDTISPGDIASLVNSNQTAFRVTVEQGNYPIPQARYWRALVLDTFDGRAWRKGHGVIEDLEPMRANCAPSGDRLKIMVEPNFMPWVFQLEGTDTPNDELKRYTNNTLRAPEPVSERLEYSLCSSKAKRVDQLTREQRDYYLWLPSGANPRALEWSTRFDGLSIEQKVERVLQHFNSYSTYTRRPAKLGEHSVDEFLFDTPRGFCEHFASSFSYMMRASGVPSRVVVGYQGGEVSPYADYLRVSQRDAHAWSEIFIENKGWVQIDPTAYVAPDRIEQGFDAPESSGGWNFDAAWYDMAHSSVMRQFILRLDAVNYEFASWVGSFDEQQRNESLKTLFGKHIIAKSIGTLIVTFLILLGLAQGLSRFKSRPRYDAATKRYLKRERRFVKEGFHRRVGETPQQFAERIGKTRADLLDEARSMAQNYYVERY